MFSDLVNIIYQWPDRIWIEAGLICFLLGFGYSIHSLVTGKHLASRLTFGLICLGFLFETIFLFARGHQIGRCPITNFPELLVFMSWSMVLIYLVIGSTYRFSLMGAFTAPVAGIMLILAHLIPAGAPMHTKLVANPWLEVHTSFSIVACGAFALACVAGAMYLFQERQLKTQHPGSIFFRLPPISALTVANSRLLWLGFGLFTIGNATGFLTGMDIDWKKVSWAILVWCLYGGILIARLRRAMAGKWIAALSIVAFSLLLGTFWGIRFISERPSL